MLKSRGIVKGKITNVLENGTGVFYQNKDCVFVRNVLLNEEVEVEVEKKIKNGYTANVKRIITPSKYRQKVDCKFYDHCGSCHLLHVNYKFQLNMKKQIIVDMVKKNQLSLQVQDCEGMENPYHYRNKIIISFAKTGKNFKAGFYEEFTHNIIPIKDCLLHEDKVNVLIDDLLEIVRKCRIEIYDEDRRRGFLRHLLIRRGVQTDQTMLTIIGAQKVFKAKSQFVKEVQKQHPEIKTIVFNTNEKTTSAVLGKDERVLCGKGFIEDQLCGLYFKISSRSFYQINHEQCEKLYTKALSLLDLKPNMNIIDAYCGIGTIGLIAAKDVAQVYGVEINKDAIKDAIENAKRNNIRNIRFECRDASDYMVQLAKRKIQIDAVIMDPARDGSDERFLKALCTLKPKQVLYISCNPQTQLRDLKFLFKNGYTSDNKLYLYDLFPQTFHVESIVKLVRNK